MTYKEFQKQQERKANKEYISTFKKQIKQNKIILNSDSSKTLQRVTTNYFKHPIHFQQINNSFYENIINLENLQLIRTKMINQNTMKLYSTKLGKKIIKQCTNESLMTIHNKLKHKDKTHKISKAIEDTCAILILVLLITMIFLAGLGSNYTDIWSLGYVWCIMAMILVISLFGYTLPSNYKMTPTIPVKEILQSYKQSHNLKQYEQYQKALQNMKLKDIYSTQSIIYYNNTNPANPMNQLILAHEPNFKYRDK